MYGVTVGPKSREWFTIVTITVPHLPSGHVAIGVVLSGATVSLTMTGTDIAGFPLLVQCHHLRRDGSVHFSQLHYCFEVSDDVVFEIGVIFEKHPGQRIAQDTQ